MDDLAVWFRFVLAFLFLSTAWSKHKKMAEHIGIVRDYQILPARLTEPFAKAETYVELLLGVLLFLGLFQPIAVAGAVMMLLVYTVAIVLNLRRGRTEMSCGCGRGRGSTPAVKETGFAQHQLSSSWSMDLLRERPVRDDRRSDNRSIVGRCVRSASGRLIRVHCPDDVGMVNCERVGLDSQGVPNRA